MKNDSNSVKLNNNPLPYLIGSLLLIFSIIFVYYMWNGNSLKESPKNENFNSQTSSSAEN